jgi:ribonuclease D
VEHLLALDDRLWASALALGIDNEVRTEVDYRLRSAVQAEPTPPPSFVRIRGLDRLDDEGRAVLKEIAAEREHWAERMDVPPFKVATDQSLLMVAVRKPASTAELVAAVGSRAIHAQAAQAIVDGVRRGVAAGRLDPDHEALLRKPKMDRGVMEQRKKWEKRLTAWRKAESERRGVHAQVVLPGHCLRSLVSGELTTAAEIAGLDGMGEARGARYASVLAAMLGEGRSA